MFAAFGQLIHILSILSHTNKHVVFYNVLMKYNLDYITKTRADVFIYSQQQWVGKSISRFSHLITMLMYNSANMCR